MNEITAFSSAQQYIKIAVGDEFYGIDIGLVDNIVRMQRITRVPNVAPYIKGVINLRGEVIPIINLRLKMDLDEIECNKMTRIIIIKTEAYDKIGVIVDEVKEVITLSEEQIEKMHYDKNDENHFVVGIGKMGDVLVSILDINAVLAERNLGEEA